MPAAGTDPVGAARLRLRLAAALLATVGVLGSAGATASAQTDEAGPITTLAPTSSTTLTETTVEETTTTEAEEQTTTTTTDDDADADADETTTTVRRTTTTSSDEGSTSDGDGSDTRSRADDDIDAGEEETTSTTAVTQTTIRDLLVPGDGSQGAESTTTTSTTVVEIADEEGISEETTIWLIVTGLVGIALLIGLWTFRYWRETRPTDVAAAEPARADPTTVFVDR